MNEETMAREYVSQPLEYVVVFSCLMERAKRTAHWDYPFAFPISLIHGNGVFLSEAIVEGKYVRNNRLIST